MSPTSDFVIETFDLHPDAIPSKPVELPPPRLGGYRVEDELGRGAMGHVYRAFDLKAGRPVALKVSRSGAPEDQARIAHEAELQGQIFHPAVPRILTLGRLPDGRAYLVQTLVRGARTLGEAARSASWVEKVEWVATAAEALAMAHGRCVTHGDVKPDNLLVDERGRLSVVDWGVSQLAECAASAPAQLSPTLREHARRHESWVQGTLAYMPPEQLRGKAGPASDVYSLGIVLFEILAGRHPLAALLLDADQVVQEIINGEPPPVPEDLPAPLRPLLARCLLKDPGQRPPAVELARSLRSLARNQRRASRLGTGSCPPGAPND